MHTQPAREARIAATLTANSLAEFLNVSTHLLQRFPQCARWFVNLLALGARAADMSAAAVTAMEYRASAEDVARMSHAHPTYMEAVKEACLAASEDRAIHV